MLIFSAANFAYQDSVPVNISNKWFIKLEAVEPFSNGRIVYEIPPNWTPPQNVSSISPGFVTLNTTGSVPISATIVDITGMRVTVTVDTIPSNEGVLLVYGNDGGGSNPNALATSPSTPQMSDFRLESHSNSQVDLPTEVSNSPHTVKVTTDVPFELAINPDNGSVIAGIPLTYTVYIRDQYGNRTTFNTPTTFDLSTSEGVFHDNYPGTIITSVVVPAFVDSFVFDYYSEVSSGGTPHTITVENLPESLSKTTNITVNPLPNIKVLSFETGPYAFTTITEGGPYTIETQDSLGNPRSVDSNQQINLVSDSPGGSFSEQSGLNFTPVGFVTIPNGQSSVTVYYRDTVTGTPTITATSVGQPTWTPDSQQQSVLPGPPTRFALTPADTTVDAGDFTQYTIKVVDAFGNCSPVTQNRTILLSPPVGNFYDPGDHGTPKPSWSLSVGDSSLVADYQSETSGSGFIVALTTDALPPVLTGVTGVTVDPLLSDAGQSTVSATSNITADGIDQSTVTVTARDFYGNAVEAVEVDLAIIAGSATVDVDPGPSDINGEAVGNVSSTNAGNATVQATAGGVTITQTAQIVFVAGGVDPDSSVIAGTTGVTADGVAVSTITVTALDGNDNPIQGASVTLSVDPPGGGAILTQPATLTNAIGQTSGTLSSTSAGNRVVKAVIDGVSAVDSAIIAFVAGPVDLNVSTVVATTPVTADDVDQSVVTVTVTDMHGNPLQGINVVVGADGDATIAFPGGLTNLAGQAFGVVRNTTAETVNVFATADLSPLSDTAQVQFDPAGVDVGTSLVSASPGSVVADGSSFSTITVTARDPQGNPTPNKPVVLSVTPNDGIVVLNPTNGVTGSDGTMTATILSTKTESYQVNAVVDGVSVTTFATVEFVPGPVASFTLEPGPSRAGDPISVTITAFDAQGNVKTDYVGVVNLTTNGTGNITWGAGSGNGIMVDGDPAQYTFAVADSGDATVAVTNDKKETFRLNASDGGASGTSLDIVVDNADAASIAIVEGGIQTATVFTDVPTSPVIRVTDAFGNPVDGEPVTFRLLAAQTGGSIDVDTGGGGPVDSTGTTDASGEMVCDRWTLGQIVGTNRLQARIQAGVFAVNFTADGSPGPAANLDILPPNQAITVDASMDVLATLGDVYGNAVPGEQVTIFIKDPADGTLSQSAGHTTTVISSTARSGITDANGQTSVSFDAPSGSGLSDNVDASSPNVPDGNVTDRVYTTVASGATNLRITFLSGSSKRAGETIPMLVEAVDGFGNLDASKTNTVAITPEAGGGLEFSLTDFGGTVTQFDLVGGQKVVYGRATTVGDWDITMSTAGLGSAVDPVSISDADVIDHYYVLAPGAVTAGANFNATVEARDVFDNVVQSANLTVDLAAVDPADSSALADLLLVPQVTLVNGRVENFAQQYPKALTMLIRASDGSGNEGFSGPVSVSTSAAYQIVKISGDISGIAAGTSQPLVAEVQDAGENPVPNAQVTFVTTDGGGVLPAQPVITGPDGRVTVSFTTGPVVGDNGIKATILDGSPESRERIDFLVSTVAGAIDNFVVAVDRTAVKAGETVNVDITALDANDNVVSQDNSTLIDLSAVPSAVVADATGQLSGGMFSTTVFDTVVESFAVLVQEQGPGTANGTSELVAVSNAAAYEIVQVTPDESGILVGAPRVLEVDVRDRYGNAVPNEFVRYTLVPQGGPDGTARLSNNGIAQTNVLGRAADSLYTAFSSGANIVDATISDGPPPAREGVTFTMTTAAGLIAKYTVETDLSGQTAGQPVNVTVRAFDSNDNLVVGDNTTPVDLLLDPGFGAQWGDALPITLTAGTLQTTLIVDAVQTYNIRAQTQGDPGTTGLSGAVAINPDVPAGVVALTPSQPTITANGISLSTITSAVITDQFGNQIPQGELVTVATTLGVIASPDQDGGTAGNQQSIRVDGMVQFAVRSATSTGVANVTMNSVNGSATGAVNITFAPPPAVATPSAPIPSSVIVGFDEQFRVPVQNTSTTGVTLNTTTTFEFTFETETYSAQLVSPTFITGSSTDTLLFNTAMVPADIKPARYQPVVNLSGNDQFGSTYTKTSLLPVQSLLVSSIKVAEIRARGIDQNISKGATDTLEVVINNPTPETVRITSVTLLFTPLSGGAKTYLNETELNLPLDIPGEQNGTARVSIQVGTNSATGVDEIAASVSGLVNGDAVTAVGPDPPLPTWEIVTARDIQYVAGSLSPTTVSIGQTYQMEVQIMNDGDATVTIDSAGTSLSFTDGTETFVATPTDKIAVPGGSSQVLRFKPAMVPSAMTPGNNRNVRLELSGVENGVPFLDVINTIGVGDGVNVVLGADIVVQTGTLSPTTVSKGATVAFQVDVQNSGGATVHLEPDATRFRFGGLAYEAYLDGDQTVDLFPGFNTLYFLAEEIGTSFTPGTYTPSIDLDGTENGLQFNRTLVFGPADQVTVQDAPDIGITRTRATPSRITADQDGPINVWMTVANNGGSTVSLDSARVRLFLGGSNRTGEFTIANPTQFNGGVDLPGGGSIDSLLFVLTDDLASAMSTGVMTIEGNLWVTDQNPPPTPIFANTNLGGKGSLVVESPAQLVIRSITPTQNPVTRGQTLPQFQIKMVVSNTGQSDARLAMTNDSTDVFFVPAGWGSAARPNLAGGDALLEGGETDTVIVDVTQAGNTPGTIQINGIVQGVELNSGRELSKTEVGLGSILVQNAAQLFVSNVVTSRPTITSGMTTPWKITVDVRNDGQALLDPIPNFVSVQLQDEDTGSIANYTLPSNLLGGGTSLAALESGQLEILVNQTREFLSFGSKTVTVNVVGVEKNTGNPIFGSGNGSVTVQAPAAPDYIPGSLDPSVVSKGSNESFKLSIRNQDPENATMRINRSLTRFRFGNSLFDAGLAPASEDVIAGGETKQLTFEDKLVSTLMDSTGVVSLELHWEENGADSSRTLILPGEDLAIQAAGQLQVVSITPSQGTITENQTQDWTFDLVVRNNGDADVRLTFDTDSTRFEFEPLVGLPVTGEYGTLVLQSGDPLISGGSGAERTYTYLVTQGGATTGPIKLTADVTGYDQTSGLPVSARGSGFFIVQTEADIRVVSITTPDQSSATAGQSRDYRISIEVENIGQSAAKLGLNRDSTSVTFSFSAGWAYTLQPTFVEGGSILRGGETGTILATIDTTGTTAQPTSVGARVDGVEMNSGRFVQGAGSNLAQIDVQNPAFIAISSVTPSQPSVTANNGREWEVVVRLSNTGEANAVFLPDSLTVTIEDGAGASYTYPTTFESLRADLPGGGESEELRIGVIGTPDIFPLGSKRITVKLAVEELNSGDRPSTSSDGFVIVQSEPGLQYVGGLDPQVVSQGTSVGFELTVRNDGANAAAAYLAPTTQFRIVGTSYAVQLTAPDTLLGNTQKTLTFNSKLVNVPESQYPVDLLADYSHNGTTVSDEIVPVLPEQVTVQAAPSLNIVSITPTQTTVTSNQTRQWIVDVAVQNNGTAPVLLDLAPTSTFLIMDHVDVGDVTGTYGITPPTQLVNAQTDTLKAGPADILRFTITSTGPREGGVNIESVVRGNNDQLLNDSRTGGTGAFITVQSPADLVVKRVSTSRTTVTQGQVTEWKVWAVVENQGGSDIALDLGTAVLLTFAPTGWSVEPASIGTDTLTAGEIDSLRFNIAQTITTAGLATIDAFVEGTEINSGDSIDFDTGTQGGTGSILVQTSANLRFVTTASAVVAPNGSLVNTNQQFRVAVELENTGEAQANQVRYQIDGGAVGIPAQSPRTVAVLSGGSTAVDTFLVTAVGSPATDDVQFTIFEAIDTNSTEWVGLTDPDSVDAVQVEAQSPAVFVVDSVVAGPQTVTKQQTQPWDITVYVSNTGGAELQLDTPTPGDISFLRGVGEVRQTDYVVLAPTELGSGAQNWRIPGEFSDSLVYTVAVTGSGLGDVITRASLRAGDVNDPDKPKMPQSGDDAVTVEQPSGLFVQTTTITDAHNKVGGVWYVNTSDTFAVSVTVENSGEAVKRVQVSLASDFMAPAPSIVETGDTMQTIAVDSWATFEFEVIAQSSSVTFQTLSAKIDSAFSANNGQRIDPSPPVDNTEFVVVQTPAVISIEAFRITAPPSAQDNTVSTDQEFWIAARATNEGEAAIEMDGQLTVTLPIIAPPDSFAFVEGTDPDTVLVLDKDVFWNVRAPGTASGPDLLTCSISTTPTDKNTGQPAQITVSSMTIPVLVLEAGELPIEQPVVISPSGATDDTVSTDQIFQVEFTTTPKPAHIDLTATIVLPPGFQTVGQSTIGLADGDGNAQTDTFTIQAPAGAGGGDITVTVSGTDKNTSQAVENTSAALIVTAVAKADLSISAWISGPPEAQDSSVTIGSIFQFQASVTNVAGAAEIDENSNPTVRLVLPAGYTPDPPTQLMQSFAVGDTNTWSVKAPGVPSVSDLFEIRIENIPDDENTNAPAAVTTRSQSIPMTTEGASVAMRDVTEDQGIDNKVVPGGTANVDKFAFSLKYEASDPSANNVRVRTVEVTILGDNGQPLSDSAVRGTLSNVYVRINGDSGETTNPQTNPVAVDLSTAGSSVIAPDGTVTLTTGVAVKSNPSAPEFSLSFQGQNSIEIRTDDQSQQLLGVVDAETGRPIGNQFQSSPLVVLSNNFEEYVHNYPNPFQAGVQPTSITYFLGSSGGDVSIKIYDLLGALVYKLEIPSGQDNATSGPQEVQWDGRNMQGEVVRNGVYVCVLSAGPNSTKFKIAVAK